MCLSKIYIQDEAKKDTLLFDSITHVLQDDGSLIFTDLMGEKYEVEGNIKAIDFTKSRLIISEGN